MKSLKGFVIAATIAILAVSAQSAFADTTWDTKYISQQGSWVTAVVTLNSSGRSGSYMSYDAYGNCLGSGTLSRVQFYSQGGQCGLKGYWQWNGGGSGTFNWPFQSSSLKRFNGWWSSGGSNGGNGPAKSWNGQFSGGQGSVGANGPVIN